jgi:hypothetical protein
VAAAEAEEEKQSTLRSTVVEGGQLAQVLELLALLVNLHCWLC